MAVEYVGYALQLIGTSLQIILMGVDVVGKVKADLVAHTQTAEMLVQCAADLHIALGRDNIAAGLVERGHFVDAGIAFLLYQIFDQSGEILAELVVVLGRAHPVVVGIPVAHKAGGDIGIFVFYHLDAAGATPDGQADAHIVFLRKVQHLTERLHLNGVPFECRHIGDKRVGIVVVRLIPLRLNHHAELLQPHTRHAVFNYLKVFCL